MWVPLSSAEPVMPEILTEELVETPGRVIEIRARRADCNRHHESPLPHKCVGYQSLAGKRRDQVAPQEERQRETGQRRDRRLQDRRPEGRASAAVESGDTLEVVIGSAGQRQEEHRGSQEEDRHVGIPLLDQATAPPQELWAPAVQPRQ